MTSQNPHSTTPASGRYRHFKGGAYEVIGVARHSETEEELVVYRSATGDLWVRPRDMFLQTTVVDGVEVPRFAPVND
ncbi:DUF1653 domain-containing protein [Salinibacterium hongtaonis]|uniref:DUF1653 domain-containing protein n=1 Tax=Homoserinimonas hongtaonis TaxID=2079791 RepID=UPI000D351DB1|nr:DUF1653 domain-containing protein [Salinibacterium hongtaonis]AWB89187.1 DUF1653 domain-containing protein [Salinibacterium hongtaonis]